MTSGKTSRPADERVLVVAARPVDADALREIVAGEGEEAVALPDSDLAGALDETVLCVVLTETVVRSALDALLDWANGQPEWSALPVLVLARNVAKLPAPIAGYFEPQRVAGLQINLLQRPAHPDVIRNALVNAVASRRRQYRIRDQIAALHASTEQIRLLSREVQHRAKNNLARLSAILNLTWKSAPSPEAFIESFQRRVQAMARGLDLLSTEEWKGASLRDLVDIEMRAAVGDRNSERLTCDGETIPLTDQSALSLHLVLHELTTNALKYGALSVEDGTVRVSWAVRDEGDGPILVIDWKEHDGPPVVEPDGKGFGSRLIDLSIRELEGTTAIAFEADGVHCEIRVPLSEVAA